MENSRQEVAYDQLIELLERLGFSGGRIADFEYDAREYSYDVNPETIRWNDDRDEGAKESIIERFGGEVLPDAESLGLTPEQVRNIAESWFDASIHQTDAEKLEDKAGNAEEEDDL